MPAALRAPFAARSGQQDKRQGQADNHTLLPGRPPAEKPGLPPGTRAELGGAGAAPSPPGRPRGDGLEARSLPRAAEMGNPGRDGKPRCRRRAGWLRAAPSTSPTCIPRPFCLLAARLCPVSSIPRPRPPPPTPPRPRPLGQRGCCGALPRAQGPGPAGGGGGRAGGPAGQEKVKRGPPAAPAAPGSGEMLPLGKALQGRGRAAHKSGEE